MKTMFYTMLLSSLVLCADKPYQDTIVTSLPKPIIPYELSYYDIRKEIKGMQRIEAVSYTHLTLPTIYSV